MNEEEEERHPLTGPLNQSDTKSQLDRVTLNLREDLERERNMSLGLVNNKNRLYIKR